MTAFALCAGIAGAAGADALTPQISIHGFSDVTLGLTRDNPPAGPAVNDASFALGQFDLYIVSRLSENLSFLGETVIETDASGATVIDLERAFVKFAWSDAFAVSAGRTHTPLGWWNEAYHHGAMLQPTIARPLALRFEDDGGLLPVHAVGLELSGVAPVGGWEASWVGNVANGRGPIPDEVQAGADLNRHKAVALKLTLERHGDGDLAFGVNGYLDHIPPDLADPARGAEIRERIGGAHARLRFGRGELLAEGFLVRHDDPVSGGTFRHRAGYVVLVAGEGRARPYVGYDRLDAQGGDPFYGAAAADFTAGTAGLRFELHPFDTIKLEFRHEAFEGGHRNGLFAQTAFSF